MQPGGSRRRWKTDLFTLLALPACAAFGVAAGWRAAERAGPGAAPAAYAAVAQEGWQVLAGGTTRPGQFNLPFGVAVDAEGNVYVADRGNGRIQKLSAAGEPLAQWGTRGSAPGQFERPSGVAVDAAGNVYVADIGNNRVQKISQTGGPLAQWGGRGSAPGQFAEPFGVTVDAEGNVYVADTGNNRIQKLPAAPR